MAAITRQFGPVGALCLMTLWIQAILTGGARVAWGRVAAAARGALLAALLLSLAGAVPGAPVDVRPWLLVVGTLIGLLEARTAARSGSYNP